MKEFWNTIQLIFAAIGGWLGYFLGGCDGLLYALIAFVVIDYITGVMCAISDHTLSSQVGFRGICRKVLIFMLVGIANVLDIYVLSSGKRFADGGYFLLHLQRGCIPSGECRASGPPDTGENQGGFGAAP